MNEPRRPIFWFLWSRPDPHARVDEAFRQVRALRVSPRGPIRLAVLVAGSALVTIVMGTAVMAAAASGLAWPTVVGGAVAATGLFLLLRGWVVGTYVSDDALTIETMLRRRSLPWSGVSAMRVAEMACPFLGLPLGVSARRVIVTDYSGFEHGTHVYSTSPDYWLRPEAFDMAALRLERWDQDCPR